MNRLVVLLLAAVDALVSVAVGIAVILAPLTLLWVLALPGADWGALWPATATIWQFAMLVPVAIELPVEYVVSVGVDPAATQFTMSLAPLAFAAFAAIFGARSGVRASQAGAWVTGVTSGTVVVAALAVFLWLTGVNPVAAVGLWPAVAFPTLLYAVPAAAGAAVNEWREAEGGVVAALRDRLRRRGDEWSDVVSLTARGSAIVMVGMLGAGALLLAVAIVVGIGDVVALYQAANVDVLGAVVLTLAQAAYLPTLIVWASAFIAGPGFSLGTGTDVSAAGSSAGIVPGIPILAVVPDDVSAWWLALVLIPVLLGAWAGWIARAHLLRTRHSRAPALTHRGDADSEHEPLAPRAVLTAGIALLSAAGAGAAAWFASGSFGPGRLESFGPNPGAVALAVGVAVAVGASILLLSPRGTEPSHGMREWSSRENAGAEPAEGRAVPPRTAGSTDDQLTAPLD